MLFCCKCKISVHRYCYGLLTPNVKEIQDVSGFKYYEFICDTCSQEIRSELICCLCNEPNGVLKQCKGTTDLFVHILCVFIYDSRATIINFKKMTIKLIDSNNANILESKIGEDESQDSSMLKRKSNRKKSKKKDAKVGLLLKCSKDDCYSKAYLPVAIERQDNSGEKPTAFRAEINYKYLEGHPKNLPSPLISLTEESLKNKIEKIFTSSLEKFKKLQNALKSGQQYKKKSQPKISKSHKSSNILQLIDKCNKLQLSDFIKQVGKIVDEKVQIDNLSDKKTECLYQVTCASHKGLQLFCQCRKSVSTGEEDMVCCEKCENWFHYSCVGETSKSLLNIDYFCRRCKIMHEFKHLKEPYDNINSIKALKLKDFCKLNLMDMISIFIKIEEIIKYNSKKIKDLNDINIFIANWESPLTNFVKYRLTSIIGHIVADTLFLNQLNEIEEFITFVEDQPVQQLINCYEYLNSTYFFEHSLKDIMKAVLDRKESSEEITKIISNFKIEINDANLLKFNEVLNKNLKLNLQEKNEDAEKIFKIFGKMINYYYLNMEKMKNRIHQIKDMTGETPTELRSSLILELCNAYESADIGIDLTDIEEKDHIIINNFKLYIQQKLVLTVISTESINQLVNKGVKKTSDLLFKGPLVLDSINKKVLMEKIVIPIEDEITIKIFAIELKKKEEIKDQVNITPSLYLKLMLENNFIQKFLISIDTISKMKKKAKALLLEEEVVFDDVHKKNIKINDMINQVLETKSCMNMESKEMKKVLTCLKDIQLVLPALQKFCVRVGLLKKIQKILKNQQKKKKFISLQNLSDAISYNYDLSIDFAVREKMKKSY